MQDKTDEQWPERERRQRAVLSKYDREWIMSVIESLEKNIHDVKGQNEEIIGNLRGKGDSKGLNSRVDLLESKVNQLWVTVFGLAGALLTGLFLSRFFQK